MEYKSRLTVNFWANYKLWPLIRYLNHCVTPVIFLVVIATGGCYAACESETEIRWKSDGRCGKNFFLPHSNAPAQCDPLSDRPCCSDYGYCGNSPSHCRCTACVDFRKKSVGPSVVAKDGLHLLFQFIPSSYNFYLPREEPPKCHFTLKKRTGLLESPKYPQPYPPGQECCYDIKRPTGDFCGVSLLVEELDVGRGEEEGFCQRDWISLPSCVPERGTRICGNTTGQYFQYLFQPGAESIRFKFHSGSMSENRTGFRIKYELLRTCPGPFQTQYPPISVIPGVGGSPPCYTRITDRRGTINTPFFPESYPQNLDCVYEFIRTDYKICGIAMTSIRFKMEDPFSTPFGGACTDFFHLPSCGFLCGAVKFSWVVHFQPGATSLRFHFHSNGNDTQPVTSPGFLINFEQVTTC